MAKKKETLEKTDKPVVKKEKKTVEERLTKLEKMIEEMRYVIGF